MNAILMEFINQKHDFAYGFECGKIWQQLSEGYSIAELPVNEENEQQIKLICASIGCECLLTTLSNGWLLLTATLIDISPVNPTTNEQ